MYRLEFSEEALEIPLVFARCVRCSLVREDTFEAGFAFFSPVDVATHGSDTTNDLLA